MYIGRRLNKEEREEIDNLILELRSMFEVVKAEDLPSPNYFWLEVRHGLKRAIESVDVILKNGKNTENE